MSEFSEKLSQYITESGYNVYQLAKEASIDRTTLQKTVKGQRLPSIDFIKSICKYFKISKAQEDELFFLYKTEKMGRSVIETWAEIQQMLLDIPELRKKTEENGIWNIHFDKQSLEKAGWDSQQTFSSEIEIMRAVMYIIDKEIMEENEPEIYMDVSYASQFALNQLVQSESLTGKPIICHQLVNLRKTDQSKDGLVGNFKILHQILPYAFAFHNNYDIRYTYVTGSVDDQKYELWPHYIVTHNHVLLCSHERFNAILFSDKKMACSYCREISQMMRTYRPLFNYQGFSGDGICKYREMSDYVSTHVGYESFPCIAVLVPDEMQEMLKKDPQIGEYAQAYFKGPDKYSDLVIDIFGMKGMKHFVQTGHLPEIFDKYIHEVDLDTRKAMVRNFHNHLINHNRQFYMINEDELSASEGLSIELYGKNKVVLCSTSEEFPFGFITIDEPGICEAFYDYFENLIDSKYVFSVEETITRYESMVEEWFTEIQ